MDFAEVRANAEKWRDRATADGGIDPKAEETLALFAELDRLAGLLAAAHGGLLRALDYRAATPEGLAIKRDVRDALRRTGFSGSMGVS